MPTPSGLVTKQELIDAQLDTAHLGRVVNSKDAAGNPISQSTNRTGGVNATLDALLAKIGLYSVGFWTDDPTLTEVNQYVRDNSTGLDYQPVTLPYTVNSALNPDPETLVTSGVLKRVNEVTQQDIIDQLGDTLRGVIFPGDDGEYLKIGDTIDQGVTHVYLPSNGGRELVAISPLEEDDFSGTVTGYGSDDITLSNGKKARIIRFPYAPTQYTLRGYEDGVDVFILYGQSNTVGYANNTPGFPKNEYNNKYWRYNTQTLDFITSDMRFSSGNVSTGHAWMEFANTFTSKTGRKCILIPCAKGESSVSELSKGGSVYTAMESSIADFESYATANNIKINSRSLLYHQGETDMIDETPHNTYIQLLDQLLRDIRADFSVDKTYIARVGCPQNRTEESWYAIQSAQDFLCQSYDWVVMSYTGCGMFTISNGLLREGVHYTQLGYNFMGGAIAETVVSNLVNPSPNSLYEQMQYGGLLTTPDQIWRHTFARCSYDSVNGWALLDIDDTSQPYRAVNVEKIEDLNDRLRIYVQSRGDYITDINVNINTPAERYGLRVVANPVTATLNVRAFDLYFYKDLNFLVSMDTGSIAPPPDTSGGSPFLNRVTTDNLGPNNYRVNHPRSEEFPLITPVYADSAIEANVKPVFITLNSALSFIVKTFAASGAKAYCSVPNALLLTDEIIDGVEISVSAKVAAKKL